MNLSNKSIICHSGLCGLCNILTITINNYISINSNIGLRSSRKSIVSHTKDITITICIALKFISSGIISSLIVEKVLCLFSTGTSILNKRNRSNKRNLILYACNSSISLLKSLICMSISSNLNKSAIITINRCSGNISTRARLSYNKYIIKMISTISCKNSTSTTTCPPPGRAVKLE